MQFTFKLKSIICINLWHHRPNNTHFQNEWNEISSNRFPSKNNLFYEMTLLKSHIYSISKTTNSVFFLFQLTFVHISKSLFYTWFIFIVCWNNINNKMHEFNKIRTGLCIVCSLAGVFFVQFIINIDDVEEVTSYLWLVWIDWTIGLHYCCVFGRDEISR